MSNYQLFLFDYKQAQRMGMDHWDSLRYGLAWVGRVPQGRPWWYKQI